MVLREMTPEDYEYMKKHENSHGILGRLPDQTEWTYALSHDGKTLGIGGIDMINLTTAWCWFNLSSDAAGHIKTCYRVIKEWLDILANEHNIKRMMAYVETDFVAGQRTLEHLGFRKESIMPGFAGDTGEKSAYLYVKFYAEAN